MQLFNLLATFSLLFGFLSESLPLAMAVEEPTPAPQVEPISPPAKLFHWTSISWLKDWARMIAANQNKFTLTTNLKRTKFGGLMERSLTDPARLGLFTWNHPIGGMSSAVGIYPENSHPDETIYSLLRMQGLDSSNEKLVEAYQQRFGEQIALMRSISISGAGAEPSLVRLVDLDIDPSARTFKITANTVSGFSAYNHYQNTVPQLEAGNAQLILFELDGFQREWVVLDPTIVRHYNADPRFQREMLEPHLNALRIRKTLAPEHLHILDSFISRDEGRPLAIKVLENLVNQSEKVAQNIPRVFSNPPLTYTRAPEMRVIAKAGNLVEERVDAYMVPHPPNGVSSGGVSGAVMGAGAIRGVEQFASYIVAHPGELGLGQAHVTKAGGGRSSFLVHVVSVGAPSDQEAQVVAKAVSSGLIAAESAGAKSIAIPALGTGVAGNLTPEQSARAVMAGIRNYQSAGAGLLTDIRIVIRETAELKASTFEAVVNQSILGTCKSSLGEVLVKIKRGMFGS